MCLSSSWKHTLATLIDSFVMFRLITRSTICLQETRLLTLIEGVLAANIFDWGSRACVDLYHKGTIIEIYRMSRKKMQRPWGVSRQKIRFIGMESSLIFNFELAVEKKVMNKYNIL